MNSSIQHLQGMMIRFDLTYWSCWDSLERVVTASLKLTVPFNVFYYSSNSRLWYILGSVTSNLIRLLDGMSLKVMLIMSLQFYMCNMNAHKICEGLVIWNMYRIMKMLDLWHPQIYKVKHHSFCKHVYRDASHRLDWCSYLNINTHK